MVAYPQYVPDYQVMINGQELPKPLEASVTGVRYQDGREAADRVEISFANSDLRWLQNHIRGLGFRPFLRGVGVGPISTPNPLPEGIFDIDNKLTLSLGYAPDPLEEVFVGEITGVEADFPNGGMPTLMLVAHDFLHRLSTGSYARGFGPLPDFLIASILSAENLIIPLIEPTVIEASTAVAAVNFIFNGTGRKQKGQSHLDLLKEIAATYDADFWVEGDTLFISRFIKEYSPRLTLTWGKSLLNFSPRISTVGQAAGVAMKFTLREIPLDFLVTVYWDFDRENLGITVLPGLAAPASAGSGKSVFTIINRPIGSPADIANSALVIAHELRQKINNRLTGEGTAIGDPRIRAGAMIRLDGLGPDFSGDYRVVSATHSMDDSGYRTNFSVRKEIIP